MAAGPWRTQAQKQTAYEKGSASSARHLRSRMDLSKCCLGNQATTEQICPSNYMRVNSK